MKVRSQMKRAIVLLLFSMLYVVAFAQAITGTVKDNSGEAIIGANVVVKGTTNGTITDFNGHFELNGVSSKNVLVFSYIGYQTIETVVGNKKTFNIVLKEDDKTLDEVVVIGYATVKKRDLTGSVSSVKPADLQKVASSNAISAMQAKIPGLDIQQSSGQAGSSISMTLRGNRSISASNSPLILVDGIEYGSTLDIPASDIESMEILKDASSTAIYGTKGANGVIIITTKRGAAGKTSVSFNSYVSFNSPTNAVKPMYGDKEVQRLIDKKDYAANYATYASTGTWGTSASTPEDVMDQTLADGTATLDIYKDKSYTDWIDLMLKNSITQNYEVSVNGGNEKTTFNISLASMFDNGLMKNDKLTRYNGRANIDHIINKIIKVGTSLNYTYRSNDQRNSGVYSQALKMTTITHAYLNDGTINATPNPWYAAHCSPLLDEVDGAYQKNVESTRFFGNAYAQLTPVKGMMLKSLFAVDRNNSRTGLYQDYESQGRYQSPTTSYISNAQNVTTGFTWQNTFNYNTNLGLKQNDFTFLLGHELNQSVSEGNSISGDAGKEHYYKSSFYDVSKIISSNVSSSYTKQSILSFFGRLNYKYAEKYLLTASIRADGSSVLAKGHKWGYFPSVAAAWRLNEESFMKPASDWLNSLKIRASYGISGNAAVSPYQTLATLTSSVPGSTDMLPASMSNTDLTWETTRSFDLGTDFSILDNRISGSIDYYWTDTKDLLYYKSAPASSVFTSVLANVGESSGNGIEVALNTTVLKNKDFSWDINWSYSHATDNIKKLADGLDSNISGTSALIVGKPVSIFYDYETNGCWNVGEYDKYVTEMKDKGITVEAPMAGYGAPGTIKIVDQNNDGKITETEDKIVYQRSPKHIFGMNNTISYKDFSLGVQLFARLGGYMSYDLNTQMNYETANWGDLDYWTPTNANAKFPSPGADKATFSTYGSALRWEKADYLKIKDITLSYNLPKNSLSKIGINSVRIYGSMKNFFTWSSVDNYDSERGGSINFPLQKQVVVGVNVQF